MSNASSTAKKVIEPITFVIEVTADKVNENGTFSGIKIGSIKSTVKDLQGHLTVLVPPKGGGAMLLRTDTLKGIKVLGEVGSANPAKKKLF